MKALGEGGAVIKRTLRQGDGWETPRAPFDVSVQLTMAVPPMDGQQCTGQPYFATPNDVPLNCSLSPEDLPAGELGTCVFMHAAASSRKLRELERAGLLVALESMHRGQEAMVCLPAGMACGGRLVPDPPSGLTFVACRVQLLDFTQVGVMLCAIQGTMPE